MAPAFAVAVIHALDDAFVHREPGVGPAGTCRRRRRPRRRRRGGLRPPARPAGRARGPRLLLRRGRHRQRRHASRAHRATAARATSPASSPSPPGSCSSAWPPLSRGSTAARAQRPAALGLPDRRRPRRAAARLFTVVPIGTAITETHKFREPSARRPAPTTARSPSTPATASASRAGIARRATARRSSSPRRRGDRTGAVAHAKLLVRHGYGVLLYDARGRGRSEASRTPSGWGWTKDVAAHRLPEGPPGGRPRAHRGLGLSTGADALIQAAGLGVDLARRGRRRRGRRVLRGLAPPAGHHGADAFFAAEFGTVRITSGAKSGPPLEDMVKRITSPCCSSRRPPRGVRLQRQVRPRRPAAAPSSTGTCRRRATRARSATRRPRTSAA